ncbi:folate family ECF transporter S component [Levilactobacillus tangyuanensis]|uniref:Folate family ECF transporter S component n=1 Tax=Levilactobacillus tangyuanensis TaxID=2486021 RepID=A0ABW1TN01_9LACO|nr:folate family ECF transporter S component [Levilactobacillus tangyuanensis]
MMTNTRLPKLDTLNMVTLGMLMALQLVLSRFSVGSNLIKVSFTFLIVALIAKWYGPWWGMMTAVVFDVVGTLISGGPYFVGFTVSAVLGSLTYALFLYGKPVTWVRVILASVVIAVVVNAILNTWWVTIMYHTPFWSLLPARVIKQLIVTPLQIVLVYWLLNSQMIKMVQARLKG